MQLQKKVKYNTRRLRLLQVNSLLLALITLLLTIPRIGFTQSTLVDVAFYSIDNGLSDHLIRDIFQDERGFIWLATSRGVNRFDGYNFKIFDNLSDAEFKISNNNVSELGQSKWNDLFIRYHNNYVYFDLLDLDTYELNKVSLLPEQGVSGFVRNIHLTREGEIYVLSISADTTRVYQYQAETGFELALKLPEEHKELTAEAALLLTPQNDFLIDDSETGLKLVSRSGEIKQSLTPQSLGVSRRNRAPYSREINIFHRDEQNRFWVSFNKSPGLLVLTQGKDGLFQVDRPEFLAQEKYYTRIWEDKQGNLLIAEGAPFGRSTDVEDLFCLRADTSVFKFSVLAAAHQQLSALHSSDFFSTIFLGLDTGFKIVQNNLSKIKTFLSKSISADQRGTVVRGITGDGKDKVYIACEKDYWYALDLKTDFLDTLSIVDSTGIPIRIDDTMNLHLDDEGYLWGVSYQKNNGSYLIKYDTTNCYAETFWYQRRFTSFIIGRDGKVWLTAAPERDEGELVKFDPETAVFTTYYDEKGANPLQKVYPYYLLESRSGLLWIGTESGLYRLDRTKGEIARFNSERDRNGRAAALKSDMIYTIHEDEKGLLWLGTNNGLSIFDPQKGLLDHLDKKHDGLASNTIYGIIPGGNGNYWISTFNGLSIYFPQFKVFRNFYHADGFSDDKFSPFSFYKDRYGRFYFGGINGFNAFYPKDLIVATTTPKLNLTQITRFSARGDSLIHQANKLQHLKNIEIAPNNTYFQIHFMLPVYSKTDKNQFIAKLEGYENDWTLLGNIPYVRYNSLPAGNYTLHINGADPNGAWSEEPIQLPIRVREKFYKTPWFILICILTVAAVGYGLFRYKLEQQVQLERLRTRLSSDIHDEVSGLLSGIAMQADVLREVSEEDYFKEKLQGIGQTSRKAMSKMSDIIWSTDSRKDRMSDLIERMREHADEILLRVNIAYDFRVDKVDSNRKIPVNIRQNLYFIYKEAINNVVKHADATRVNIRLANQGNYFQMMVHNNGEARKRENKKGGQGLSNIRMRAQRINANVDIYNHNGFTVKLSMKKFV